MTDQASLIRAILAQPSDDLPRLVFADWLDEHGESDRAAFIRTSVAASRDGTENGWTLQPHIHHAKRLLFVVHGLRAGEYLYRRGFVSEVRCSSQDWLAHGPAIRERHPVERVTLTTWPNWFYLQDDRTWVDTNEPDWSYDYVSSVRIFAARAFYRWPGIAFTLPPDIWTADPVHINHDRDLADAMEAAAMAVEGTSDYATVRRIASHRRRTGV